MNLQEVRQVNLHHRKFGQIIAKSRRIKEVFQWKSRKMKEIKENYGRFQWKLRKLKQNQWFSIGFLPVAVARWFRVRTTIFSFRRPYRVQKPSTHASLCHKGHLWWYLSIQKIIFISKAFSWCIFWPWTAGEADPALRAALSELC